MAHPTYCGLLFAKHLVNSCIHFRNPYILQSRPTQRALINKRYLVLFAPATFDRAIRYWKDFNGISKRQRTTRASVVGGRWNSSITAIKWAMVLWMWRLGELTKGQFEELKRIFGLAKKRGPAELRATPAPVSPRPGKGVQPVSLVPS